MAEIAAHLLDHVFQPLPVRQKGAVYPAAFTLLARSGITQIECLFSEPTGE